MKLPSNSLDKRLLALGLASLLGLQGCANIDSASINPTNLALGAAFDSLETGSGSRWNNSISYNSPNWSGFDMRAIYSFGETVKDSFSDASNDASKFGLGLRYANGPLYLTAMYQTVLDNNGTNPLGVDQTVETEGFTPQLEWLQVAGREAVFVVSSDRLTALGMVFCGSAVSAAASRCCWRHCVSCGCAS